MSNFAKTLLGTAYLTERALTKAGAPRPPAASPALPPAAVPGKRNAAPDGNDDASMTRALERAERRIAAMLDDERNSHGYGDVIDLDPYDGSYIAG